MPFRNQGSTGVVWEAVLYGNKESMGFIGKPIYTSIGETCRGRHISKYHQFKAREHMFRKER